MAGKKKTLAEKQADEDHIVRQQESAEVIEGDESNEPEPVYDPVEEAAAADDFTADPDKAFGDGGDDADTVSDSPEGALAAESAESAESNPPPVEPVKSPRKPRVKREQLGFRGHTQRIAAVASILGAHQNLASNFDLTIDDLAELIRQDPAFADSIDLIDETRTLALFKQARQWLIQGGKIDHEQGKLTPRPRKPRTGTGRGSSKYKEEMAARNAADQQAALEAYEASLKKPDIVEYPDDEGDGKSGSPYEGPDD